MATARFTPEIKDLRPSFDFPKVSSGVNVRRASGGQRGQTAPYPVGSHQRSEPYSTTSIRNPCVTSVRTASRNPGSSPAFSAATIAR